MEFTFRSSHMGFRLHKTHLREPHLLTMQPQLQDWGTLQDPPLSGEDAAQNTAPLLQVETRPFLMLRGYFLFQRRPGHQQEQDETY